MSPSPNKTSETESVHENESRPEPVLTHNGLLQAPFFNSSNSTVLLLSRHGETQNNQLGIIGGDSNLSSRGLQYAAVLANYINNLSFTSQLELWTSSLSRTKVTTAAIKAARREAKPQLDELRAGIFDGFVYEEMQTLYPEEYALRDLNKYYYRYPCGESYEDVVERLRPVLSEYSASLEKNETRAPLFICSHQATLRCVLAHFLKISPEQTPYIEVPLHTVIWLVKDKDSKDWNVSFVKMPVEAVNTFRPKGTSIYPVDPTNSHSDEEISLNPSTPIGSLGESCFPQSPQITQ